MNFQKLTAIINKFARDRDWEQFHNPKDLAIVLGIEVSELQELKLNAKKYPVEKSRGNSKKYTEL